MLIGNDIIVRHTCSIANHSIYYIHTSNNRHMKKLSQKQLIAVLVSLVVITLFFAGSFVLQSMVYSQSEVSINKEISMDTNNTSFSSSVSGFEVEDLVVGTGVEATPGKVIVVNYRGALTDGQVFDSSYERGQPFSFTLGAGQVISGWDKGFAGMKVGGKRRLIIPSDMGYGPSGVPNVIPPNATLIFEVELLDVR